MYPAAAIWVQASINNLGSSFTACWKMGTALLPIFSLWCANIFLSSFNILLQFWLRPSDSRKQLTYSSYSVSLLSELLLLLLGVAGWSDIGVQFCIGSVGCSGVILASFPVGAGGVVPTSVSVGAGGLVPACFWKGTGGMVGWILVQREAYVDIQCSCRIGDEYSDLSIHLFDTYTRRRLTAALALNLNPLPHDDWSPNLRNTPPGRYHNRMKKP